MGKLPKLTINKPIYDNNGMPLLPLPSMAKDWGWKKGQSVYVEIDQDKQELRVFKVK